MLPYPNPHHFGFSQESQHPNPTPSSFPMPAPPPASHLDQHHYDHLLFPSQLGQGHGHYFNSETLEAVLVRPPRAAAPSERDQDQAITEAVPQGARHSGVAAGAAGQIAGHQQGHARARKRPFRTDRHSKIRTAQGVRDRRMRLSLDVARDFFALQDRLGFDKASKTVDWLLTQSKPAIDRLTAEPASHHHRRRPGSGSGGDAAMSSSPMSASEVAKDSAAGSGGGGADRAATSRNGAPSSSAFMDHGCCELDRLVAAAPVLGEYYYEFGEMMSANGGEGDDDGEYDEDGDFLDGMQY